MLITRASEYALLSLIVLAKADKPLDADTLSRELDISKSFLAKILQSMARAGILNSYKGANGGFALARDMREITVHNITCAAEGKNPSVFDCSKSQKDCPSDKASTCQIWPVVNRLQEKIDTFLDNLTLADLIEQETN
jgi:Rrf2 family iron-sulfur cluster assembly transcriptional regulator